MPSILIVDKTGVVKSLNVKTPSNDELYKKAGFKSNTDFVKQTTWNVDLHGTHYTISLYGKKTGMAKQENKYEFPPPVDNALYFGSCVLFRHERDFVDVWKDLSVADWEKVYEHLYGGFEDIGSEDSSESETDSSDSMHALPKTKSGYAKDDFIVDDDEYVCDDDYDYHETESKKPKKQSKKVKDLIREDPKPGVPSSVPSANEFLDCTSELSEEEYIE